MKITEEMIEDKIIVANFKGENVRFILLDTESYKDFNEYFIAKTRISLDSAIKAAFLKVRSFFSSHLNKRLKVLEVNTKDELFEAV